MPNAQTGCSSLQTVFVNNVYSKYNSTYAWGLTAAISGAHTLGAAHLNYSGFNGYWSDVTNQGIFNNNYYQSIIAKGWYPLKNVGGNSALSQWVRVDQGNSSNGGTYEMMLNSDMCLYTYSYGAYANASAGNCCAWTASSTLFSTGAFTAK